MNRLRIYLVAFALLWVAFLVKPGFAKAASVTLNADTSHWIDQHAPDAVYSSNNYIIASWAATSEATRGMIHFDVSGIPAGSTINSATLNLYNESCGGNSVTLDMQQLFFNWSDSTASWNNYIGSWSSRNTLGLASPCSQEWQSLDIKDFVSSWIGGTANYGIGISGPESGEVWARRFTSPVGYAPWRPTLVVNYSAPGPVISSLGPNNITQTTATIYWATANEMSTSILDYGLTAAYGSQKQSYALVNSHLLTADSLSPGTTYHYRVTSYDGSGYSASSDDGTFTTESATPSDTTPPVLSNLQVTNISKYKATISWDTNEASTTQVRWSTDQNNLNSTGGTIDLVTHHSFTLVSDPYNLTPNTHYYFQVSSADASGNPGTLAISSFTTASDASSGSTSITQSGNDGSQVSTGAAQGNTGNTSNNNSTTTGSNGVSASNTTSPGAAMPTATAIEAVDAQKTVDQSIASPIFLSVQADGRKHDATNTDQFVASAGQVLTIDGSSFAGAAISIIIGDKAYTTTADQNGSWEVAINTADLSPAEYVVKAQAQDAAQNKGSEIVNLFNLKVDKAVTPTKAASQSKSFGQKIIYNKYRWYVLSGLALFLTITGISVFFLIRKNRMKLSWPGIVKKGQNNPLR